MKLPVVNPSGRLCWDLQDRWSTLISVSFWFLSVSESVTTSPGPLISVFSSLSACLFSVHSSPSTPLSPLPPEPGLPTLSLQLLALLILLYSHISCLHTVHPPPLTLSLSFRQMGRLCLWNLQSTHCLLLLLTWEMCISRDRIWHVLLGEGWESGFT